MFVNNTSIPSFVEIGLSEDIKKSIHSYVLKNQEKWDKELETSQKVSKFIRHEESGLPFSIEYWNDKTYLVYTKKYHASGNNKKILYSGDIEKRVLFARGKPRSTSGKNKLEREAQKIDSFSGTRGLVQNARTSHYLNKAQDAD